MPRNVRNFWIDLSVDGNSSRVETGPRAKDGGFNMTILIRDKGGVERAMEVSGHALSDGRLRLVARVSGQPAELTVETER